MKRLIVKIDNLGIFYRALITQFENIAFENRGSVIINYDSSYNKKIFCLKFSGTDDNYQYKVYDIIGLDDSTSRENYIPFVKSLNVLLSEYHVEFEIQNTDSEFKVNQKVYNSETREYGIITKIDGNNIVVIPYVPNLVWHKNDIEIVGKVELGG